MIMDFQTYKCRSSSGIRNAIVRVLPQCISQRLPFLWTPWTLFAHSEKMRYEGQEPINPFSSRGPMFDLYSTYASYIYETISELAKDLATKGKEYGYHPNTSRITQKQESNEISKNRHHSLHFAPLTSHELSELEKLAQQNYSEN